jgi:hypothetical protein
MMGKRRSGSVTTLSAPRASQPTHDKVTAMIHPDSELSRPVAVRAGQLAPVTCASCGCRLAVTGEAWFHFSPLGGRDARGCRIACADSAHDAAGRAISLSV